MRKCKYVILLSVLILVQMACNFPRKDSPPSTSEMINTVSAMTVEAFRTRQSSSGGDLTKTVSPYSTVWPTLAPKTPFFTTEALTMTSVPCDRAVFVKDVTIPDGTTLMPGTEFTKTWEIKNAGSCTWESGYLIAFANEGHAMNGEPSKAMENVPVEPGSTVKISVDLVAPEKAGTYRGVWGIRNPTGVDFGDFWVEIEVVEEVEGDLALIKHMCSATWRSNDDIIPCSGDEEDSDGFVYKEDAPKFENGYVDDEPAIIVGLPSNGDAEISGKFLAVKIPENAHFKSVVGCVYGAEDCDVKLLVFYQEDGGTEKALGEWNERNDGSITSIDVDLEALGLSGKSVNFRLVTKANVASDENQAFWLYPAVVE